MSDDDRYEPLPDLAALPAWLWRRTSRRLRSVLAAAFVGAVAAGLTLAVTQGESRRERDAVQAGERAQAQAALITQQRAEQVPRERRSRYADRPGAAAPQRLAARSHLIEEMQAQMLADARERRLDGPLLRVQCERFPRAAEEVRPERDLEASSARYSCLVVTAEFEGGLIGHRYRSRVDFRDGRYAFCKIAGRPGVERDPAVTTPRACGG